MLERLWKRILRRGPYSLWNLPAFLLWLASFAYRAGFALKRTLCGKRIKVSVPVISVGNITVGGSGKTPLVAGLARDLLADGFRVGIVSSGYGRSDDQPFVESGHKVREMAVTRTGDETMLLAQQVPDAWFSVARVKSVAAQKLADSDKVDLIIIDDGFQHFGLERDLDLVTYDSSLTDRFLKPFPYGLLRESKQALARTDIIVITHSESAEHIDQLRRELNSFAPKAAIYFAGYQAAQIVGRATRRPVKYLEDKAVYLFAGVGNFKALETQVSALSARITFALELSDHQRYDQEFLQEIKAMVDQSSPSLVLTTLKDWVKIGDFDFGREFYYLDLLLELEPGEGKLSNEVKTRLNLVVRGA